MTSLVFILGFEAVKSSVFGSCHHHHSHEAARCNSVISLLMENISVRHVAKKSVFSKSTVSRIKEEVEPDKEKLSVG